MRGGSAIVSLDTIYSCRSCATTMKAMQFNEDFLALPNDDFESHSILVLKMTSL